MPWHTCNWGLPNEASKNSSTYAKKNFPIWTEKIFFRKGWNFIHAIKLWTRNSIPFESRLYGISRFLSRVRVTSLIPTTFRLKVGLDDTPAKLSPAGNVLVLPIRILQNFREEQIITAQQQKKTSCWNVKTFFAVYHFTRTNWKERGHALPCRPLRWACHIVMWRWW